MKLLSRPLLAIFISILALTGVASGQVDITTWQVNLQHTGNNANETILTPGNIAAPGNFGQLFSQSLDGQTYGQCLYMGGLNVSGTTHNIVYVCTEHCSIYAFDADNNVGPNVSPIWHDSLLPAGTVPVPQSAPGLGSGDITVEVGLTTTPVIDPSSSTIYIVSKVQRTSDSTYHQYLYALDLTTGTTKFGSPVEINPTFPGSSSDSSGGVIPFSAFHQHSRAAMTLNNGIVYISYASHSDTTPYHGEIIGYNATTLQQAPSQSFITTPNGMEGGIWGGGSGPAFDVSGSNMFVSVANGSYDQSNPQNGTDWSESMVKIPTTTGTGLAVSYSNTLNWFTPNIWNNLNGGDLDLGSGGLTILPDQTGPHTHIMVGGGKGAVLYVVDRDNLSGLNNPDLAIQEIPEVGGDWLFVTPSYYNGYIYYSPSGGPLEQRAVAYNATNGSYIANPPITSNNNYGGKGFGCFISSNGTNNGIVWILNGSGIDAYNATNVSGAPIYTANSTLPGNVGTQNTKFSLPMVANGKVYYTAFDSNNTGHLIVSGLLASGSGTPAAPSNAAAMPNSSSTVTVTWTNNANNETGFSIQRATAAAGPFTQVGTANAGVSTYTDTGLSPSTTYYYLVEAYNGNGASPSSGVVPVTTFPNYTVSGLVAYWNFDETTGSTVHDLTGNGNTGTINGEALLATGLINNGVNFHGTGQATANVTVSNTSTMQFSASQSFTLSAWVNDSALRGSEQTIIAKSRDQGNYYGIWINAANEWVFRGPGGDIVGPAATQGAWTHVAAVQDGVAGTRTLYVNGVAVATGAAQAADGAGALWMAQQNITGTFESFPGTLDEVRLYNTALSATQITNLMSAPVVQASSVQTQGNAGTFADVIFPSVYQVTEPRKGSTVGNYSLVLNFSAPVSGITATLGLQGGGSAVGSVGAITYDSTGTVVTVALTGVANLQALDLHLANVPSGSGAPTGTQDIPFNVLWGDANADSVVDALDASIVQNSETALVNSKSFLYDINCDGAVNATDLSLVTAAEGTNLGSETPTDLAVFQPVTASSVNGGNVAANAVDNNLNTRWESTQGSDPQWIYVNLGSVCTINAVNIAWETAAGSNYLIQVSNDATNWTTVATITGNTLGSTNGSVWQNNTGLNATGQYVRMYGETRDSPYGYSMWDYQVIGTVGGSGGGGGNAPVITGALTASGTVGSAFNYQIMATNNPTSYAAPGLPGGLSLSGSGDITGMPASSGTTNVQISAINSSGTGTATLTIGIAPAPLPPVITSSTTASGNVGAAFNYQIIATNNPTTYTESGALPGGLSFTAATGMISGTPAATGSSGVSITAGNAYGSGTAPLEITINPPPMYPPTVTAATTDATGGVGFNYQIAATNSPTSFAATNLPPGMSVNPNTGLISGTPTTPGTYYVTVAATNGTGTSSATITIVVGASTDVNLALNQPAYASSVNGGNVASFAVDGNTGTRWESVQGNSADPSWIYVDLGSVCYVHAVDIDWETAAGENYVIQTSNDATTWTTVVTVTGNMTSGFHNYTGLTATGRYVRMYGTMRDSQYGYSIYEFQVWGVSGPAPAINSGTTAIGTVGSAFAYLIGSTNNPLSFTAGSLPSGLSLNGALISGTPTASGTTSVPVSAVNTSGTGSTTLSIVINSATASAPVFNATPTLTGTAGAAFNYLPTATNSPSSYNVTGLPSGLLYLTGTVNGSPNNAGTSNISVTATNGSGATTTTVPISISPGIDSNLAFNQVATALSNTTGNAPGNAFDENYGTRWESTQGVDPEWIYVNLGQVDTIHSVVIDWENAAGENYEIDVSNDANTWTPIQTVTGNTSSGPHTYPGLNVTGQYVRMYGTMRDSQYGYSIYEMQVFGISGTVPPAPVINSTLAASGTSGMPFSYQMGATNSPTNYGAIGLPSGLSMNSSGLISGTPTMTGSSSVILTAANGGGATTGTLALNVVPPAPVITSSLSATGTNSLAFSYQITASNTPTSFGATPLPAGLSVNGSGLISGTPTMTGSSNVTISAGNAGGSGTATLALNVLPPPPAITTEQGSQQVNSGQGVTFSISATGAAPLTYQWYMNGVAISGATGSSYTIASTTSASAGNYSVTVTDEYGDPSTDTYTLTVNSNIPAMPLKALATLAALLFLAAGRFLVVKHRKA